MNSIHALTLAGTVATMLFLGGCNTPGTGPGSASFGNAVRQNVAVQAVDPEPAAIEEAPALDANRTAIAIGRYQVDEVKEPRRLRTSDVGGGS